MFRPSPKSSPKVIAHRRIAHQKDATMPPGKRPSITSNGEVCLVWFWKWSGFDASPKLRPQVSDLVVALASGKSGRNRSLQSRSLQASAFQILRSHRKNLKTPIRKPFAALLADFNLQQSPKVEMSWECSRILGTTKHCGSFNWVSNKAAFMSSASFFKPDSLEGWLLVLFQMLYIILTTTYHNLPSAARLHHWIQNKL